MTSKIKLFITGTVLAISMPLASAQQTFFNVPSDEVSKKNEIYLQHQSTFRPYKPNRYYETNNNFAYGIGHNTELDVTLFNVETPNLENMAIGVGFKTSIPILKKRLPDENLKLTVGDIFPISLSGHGVGNWAYTHISGTIPKLNTRLIAGVSAGSEDIFGRDTVHAIAAVKQPLTKSKKLQLIADWFSGTHDYGFFTPGLSYQLNQNLTIQAGYQIPNNHHVGHSGFTVQLQGKL